MSAFSKIIGYTQIKEELKQISDTLKNREVYEALGVSAPRGLLLYGEPGVGKSLMASSIIEDTGLPTYICRKDKPTSDFLKEINTTFKTAAENTPSIVYLDDMDKFANGDERHPDAEEYVTVQSCIDEVKGKQVFVLATVNNLRCLPRSLYRAGRFDRMIKVEAPTGIDAEHIVAHYLSNKKMVDDIDPKTIARILNGRSCAELETVINEAGLNAGYHRSKYISMDNIMEACLKTLFNLTSDGDDDDFDFEDYCKPGSNSANVLLEVAYHEAGHAVISEILSPGSVTFMYMHKNMEQRRGLTAYYNDKSQSAIIWSKCNAISALGGQAAIEQKFGYIGDGCERDFDKAFDIVHTLVKKSCVCGFHYHDSASCCTSEKLMAEQEQAAASEIEKYYRKAKEILTLNHDFLEKLSVALYRKGLLSAVDIQKIKEECVITPVVI